MNGPPVKEQTRPSGQRRFASRGFRAAVPRAQGFFRLRDKKRKQMAFGFLHAPFRYVRICLPERLQLFTGIRKREARSPRTRCCARLPTQENTLPTPLTTINVLSRRTALARKTLSRYYLPGGKPARGTPPDATRRYGYV